jgi:predicted nucleic acid-binding protein
MKSFLDTSVLVATFYGEHEHHDVSLALFISLTKKSGCTAAHCLAEVYAVLTGMPGKDRVTPDEALLFLADVRARLAVISLSESDYVEVLAGAAKSGLVGGGIYDALLAQCALNARSGVLYTWNVKHFTRLGASVAALVRRP